MMARTFGLCLGAALAGATGYSARAQFMNGNYPVIIVPPPYLYPNGAPEALSFYDAAPLRATLEHLVDFALINAEELGVNTKTVDDALKSQKSAVKRLVGTDGDFGKPLGPVVRQDDMQWFNIVKWVNFAMIYAEELGVGSKTIDDALKSQNSAVKRLVGTEGDFGKPLGLSSDWAVRAIRAVGNYGEVFDRNVGAHSKLGIPRGLNELWNNGGIQYAPPIR